MDGLFELMFIGIFVLASIFDAVARSRRKKRRVEDMEAEEAEETGGQDRAEEYSVRDWEPEAREQESWERSGSDGSTTTATRERAADGSTSSGRGTSDDMVPDDLWAILTGEERPGSTPAEEEPEPPAEPHIPMPVPSDRYGSPAGAGGIGDRGAAIGVAEIGSGDRPEVRPAARAAGSLARRPVGALDDSIATIHSRSRQGASPYVANLRRAGRTGLREAVVLSEALGDPVSLRAGGGGWEGEPR